MKNNTRIIDFRYAPVKAQMCIGLVDDLYKTLVFDDGTIAFDYSIKHDLGYYQRISDKVYPVRSKRIENRGFKFRYQLNFTHKDKLVERNQTFSDPRLAIAKTDEDYNDSHLSYQAFAYRSEKGARIDVLLYRLEAKETFSTVRSSVVLSALGDDPDKSHEIHTAMGIKTTVNKEVNRDFFGPGEVQEGAFFFIHHGPFTKEEATLDNAKKALAWSTAYWKDFKPFENRFEIPDECVEEMLHSCGRNIYQAREVKNNVPVFQVGPTMYRGLWMVDGHFILEAAQVMGNRKDAFDGLLAVLRRVRPDGSIVEMDFHGKETGIAIATLVRQCELMGDDERLKELWPTLLRARDYIAAYRQEAKEMEDYIGVFPSNFGDGGLYGPEPEYTTIHWMLYGLKAGYDAGKRLDLPGYSHFKSLFDEIMTAYDKTVKRDALHTGDGIPYIPQYMLKNEVNRYELDNWVGPPEEISWEGYNPQTGIWAFSQAIGFGEVFDPEDTNVKNLLQLVDSIDDEEGIPAGTAWSTQGLCTYFSMFEAQAWLYCGRGDKAVDYIYAFANHASPARVWREEQGLRESNSLEIVGDMPHNWGSAMFILLVRNILILEKQGNLELLAGLPEQWLPTRGKDLTLELSPTRYGEVSLIITYKEEGTFEFDYQRKGTRTPENIILHWSGKADFSVSSQKEGSKYIITGDCESFKAKLFY